jgi:hypothetical protein
MALAEEYQRQFAWRRWPRIWNLLPPLDGKVLLDLDAYAREPSKRSGTIFTWVTSCAITWSEPGSTYRTPLTLDDPELAFDGPASPEVTAAWRSRLDRLKLREAPNFSNTRDEFLAALAHPDHRSRAKVYCYIATVGGAGRRDVNAFTSEGCDR